MAVNQKVTNIYNLLSKNGDTNAKSVEEFAQRMSGNAYRQQIYGFLKKQGVGGIGNGYSEFTKLTGYGTKPKSAVAKKQSAPKAESTQQATSVGQQMFGGQQPTPVRTAQTKVTESPWGKYSGDYSTPIDLSRQPQQKSQMPNLVEQMKAKDKVIDEMADERNLAKKVREDRVPLKPAMTRLEQQNKATAMAKADVAKDKELQKEIQGLVDKSIAHGDVDFNKEAMKQIAFQNKYGMGGLGSLAVSEREANLVRDPEKLTANIQKNMQSQLENYVQKHGNEIAQKAAGLEMSEDEYINQYVVPQIKEGVASTMNETQIMRNMPKDDADYILNGVSSWVPIAAVRSFVETPGQFSAKEEATRRYGENVEGWTKFGRGAVEFADPSFGVAFKGGGMVGKGIAKATGLTWLAEKGASKMFGKSAEYAAKFGSASGAKMDGLLSQATLKGLGKHYVSTLPAEIIGQGLGMNMYGALQGGVQTLGSTGDLKAAGETAWEALTDVKGFASSAAFATFMPLLHSGWNLMGAGYKKGASVLNKAGWIGARAGYEAGSVLGTAAVMHIGHNLGAELSGENVDWGWKATVNGTMEETAMAAAMKFNPNLLKQIGASVKSGKWFGSEGGVFSKADEREIIKATGAKDLHEAMLSIFPDMTKSGGTASAEQVAEAQTRYLQVLNNLSWDAQNKLNVALTGSFTVQRPRTASFSFKGDDVLEHDKDGNVLSVTSFKNEDEKRAYITQKALQTRNVDFFDVYGTALDKDKSEDKFETKYTIDRYFHINSTGITYDEFEKARDKEPTRRTARDWDILAKAKMALEDIAYPEGEVHVEHSENVGRSIAESVDILGDNPDHEKIAEESVKGDVAIAELNEVLKDAEWADDYRGLVERGASDEEALAMLTDPDGQYGYNEADLAPLAKAINAKREQGGFMASVGDQIDTKVSELTNQATSGKKIVNGQEIADMVVKLVDREGNEVTMLSGDITIDGDVSESDQPIIYMGADGKPHTGKASDFVQASFVLGDEFADATREELGVKATNVIDPEGKLNPANQGGAVETATNKEDTEGEVKPLGNTDGNGANVQEGEKFNTNALGETINPDRPKNRIMLNRVQKAVDILNGRDVSELEDKEVCDLLGVVQLYKNGKKKGFEYSEGEQQFFESIAEKAKELGYEVDTMQGKQYTDQMPFEVEVFIPDDNLNEGENIISGSSRPLIRKNGNMIQAPKLTVRQGSKVPESKVKTTEGGIPLGEDGEPVYTADGVKASQVVDEIYNKSGLDKETADGFVDDKLDEAKKAYEKAQKKEVKLKKGEGLNAFKARKAENDAIVEAAKKEADRWQEIYDEAKKILPAIEKQINDWMREYEGAKTIPAIEAEKLQRLLGMREAFTEYIDGKGSDATELPRTKPSAVAQEKPKSEKPTESAKPAGNGKDWGSQNKVITTDAKNELLARLKKKMSQANEGVDPELLEIGTKLAMYHIEAGAHKFADYVKALVRDLREAGLGSEIEKLKNEFKSWYAAASVRDEFDDISDEFDERKAIKASNVDELIKSLDSEVGEEVRTEQSVADVEGAVAEDGRKYLEETYPLQISEGDKEKFNEFFEHQMELGKPTVTEKDGYKVTVNRHRSRYRVSKAMDDMADIFGEQYKSHGSDRSIEYYDKETDTMYSINFEGAKHNGEDDYIRLEKCENASVGYSENKNVEPNKEINDGNTRTNGATGGTVQEPEVGTDAPAVNGGVRTSGTGKPNSEQPVGGKSGGNTGAVGNVSGASEKVGDELTGGKRGGENTTAGGVRVQSDGESGTGNGGRVRGGGRGNGGSGDNAELNPAKPVASDPTSKGGKKTYEPKNQRNYSYPEDKGAPKRNKSKELRLSDNVTAIELLHTLISENRDATAEEREILARFTGWGKLDVDNLSNEYYIKQYGSANQKALVDIIKKLDPDGKMGLVKAIQHSALTSFYTPVPVARAMNNFLKKAGFKSGSMLDPSMGLGVFEGTLPESIKNNVALNGVELDWLTGNLVKRLYPDANIKITGFEKVGVAPNSHDVVMSNIPFGDFGVADPSWIADKSPVRDHAQKRIHNYFAVKMLESTKPGGLCVIMTSNAIMDTKGNKLFRDYIADNAELVGAIRLPDNTFAGADTKVVTDVLFLRKFRNEEDRANTLNDEEYASTKAAFLSEGSRNVDGIDVKYNGYYDKHPEMLIGDVKAGGQYREDEFGLHYTTEGNAIDEISSKMEELVDKLVGDRAGKLIDTKVTKREALQAVRESFTGDADFISTDNLIVQNGKVGKLVEKKNEYGEVERTFVEDTTLKKMMPRVEKLMPLRKAMKQIVSEEINRASDERLKELRDELNKAYNEYVDKFGRLNEKDNDYLDADINGFSLRNLEKWEEGKFVGLSDIFTKKVIKAELDKSAIKSAQDVIAASLSEYGDVREEFLKEFLGDNWREETKDLLFELPNSDGSYETKDAYLSGDVKTKLEQAKIAAETDERFKKNVEALEAVQPKDIPFDDIVIHMGARWIPVEMYNEFAKEILGLRYAGRRWGGEMKSKIDYIKAADAYEFRLDEGEMGPESVKWTTNRCSASKIFEAALLDKTITIKDKVSSDPDIYEVNVAETEAANDKVTEMREIFEDWLSQKSERIEGLQRLYNDLFNRTVLREWDGSHLTIPGLMGMELRPHQKDAVWMLLNQRGGIVDHIVGAGKSLVMFSTAMEMRRMGIAKKPMIIGLKATLGQLAKEFAEAFPQARILFPTEKDFEKKNRKNFLAKIAQNDYDCVVMSHENYCNLPHSEEVENRVANEKIAQIEATLEYMRGQTQDAWTKRQIKGLEKRIANEMAKIEKRRSKRTEAEFTFEEMGIDYMFVDECQAFKNLAYTSASTNVAGLGPAAGSAKSDSLLLGVRYLQSLHQGDFGTVFLSGTTLTNSVVEAYNHMNYLRPGELDRLGMNTFDAWASCFTQKTKEFEYGVTNELKEKTRFRNFDNLPELARMYKEIADVRNDENLKLPKPKMNVHIVTVPQTEKMAEINREIINMVKTKNGNYFGKGSDDKSPWGLIASDLSSKAALSLKLIDETIEDEGGKIPMACKNIKDMYDKFAEQKGCQMIFLDKGVGKDVTGQELYGSVARELVNQTSKEQWDAFVAEYKIKNPMPKGMSMEAIMQSSGEAIQNDLTKTKAATTRWMSKICKAYAERHGIVYDSLEESVKLSTGGYSAYRDIINRLVNEYGIPRNEVVDIHEAKTQADRKELFRKANAGEVRILIGGTKNMGTGVNAQVRLIAEHHLDIPWTPSDVDQRNGRGARQGNVIARDHNDNKVEIFYYATEGSLDMYKYQLQDIKGKMFDRFKMAALGERSFDEGADGDALDPAEVVAMLSGNSVILDKSKQDKLVAKLRRAKRSFQSDYQRKVAGAEDIKATIERFKANAALNIEDGKLISPDFKPDEKGVYPSKVTVTVDGESKTFDKPKEAGEYIKDALNLKKGVELSGYGITARYVDEMALGKSTFYGFKLITKSGLDYEAKCEASMDATHIGTIYRTLLQRVLNNREVYAKAIAEKENFLANLDLGDGVWPKEKELEEAIEKQKELDKEYRALANNDIDYEVGGKVVYQGVEYKITGVNKEQKIIEIGGPGQVLEFKDVEKYYTKAQTEEMDRKKSQEEANRFSPEIIAKVDSIITEGTDDEGHKYKDYNDDDVTIRVTDYSDKVYAIFGVTENVGWAAYGNDRGTELIDTLELLGFQGKYKMNTGWKDKKGNPVKEENVWMVSKKDPSAIKRAEDAIRRYYARKYEEGEVRLSEDLDGGISEDMKAGGENDICPAFKNNRGTTIKRGGTLAGVKHKVGKVMMGKLYIHKDYAKNALPDGVLEEAEQYLPEGFEYRTVCWDPKTPNVVRFDECPNFDTVKNPRVGRQFGVDVTTGKPIYKTKDGSGIRNEQQIFHDKWQWVDNDYQGFDVKGSYDWSKEYNAKIDGTPNGRTNKWEEQLENAGLKDKDEVIRYKTSDELDKEYPGWREQTKPKGQANEGGHSTQIPGTRKTYQKVGKWMLDNGMKDAEVLDASSGMGLGTLDMREMGLNVEDVEPYPGAGRVEDPTYASYDEIDKQYDLVVSNAVLNVIPDDWRADLLKSMADKVKPGGKMFINCLNKIGVSNNTKVLGTRANGKPNEVLVMWDAEHYRAYQHIYSGKELADYVKEQLGDGWKVETAKKAGIDSSDAIVVTRETDEVLRYREVPKEVMRSANGDATSRTTQSSEVIRKHVEKVGKGVQMHTDMSGVPAKARKGVKNGTVKGWWDEKTNSVHLYMPNIKSKYEAEKTIAHETVGHKGMRGLLNTKENPNGYNRYMDMLWQDKSNTALHEFVKKHMPTRGWDLYEAIDEWIAREAEKDVTPENLSMWGKIKYAFTEAIRKAGYMWNPDIADVRYALWLAKRGGGNSPLDPLWRARKAAMREKIMKADYSPAVKDGEYVSDVVETTTKKGAIRASEELEDNLDTMGMGVRDHYDSVMQTNSFKRREAFIDSMESLRVLQKLIAKGKEVKDSVNAYLAENHITSVAEAQWNKFRVQRFKPLEDAINQCVGIIGGRSKTVLDKVDMYAYKKHGLERNREMWVKDALKKYAESEIGKEAENNYKFMMEESLSPDDMADMDRGNLETADKIMGNYRDAERELFKQYQNGEINYRDYLEGLDDFIRERIDAEYNPKTVDYSGISEFDANRTLEGKDVEYNEDEIIDSVVEMEEMLGKDRVDNLWSKVKEATDFGVDYAYESGQADKDSAENVKGMYHWYVPLRGFAEDKMEDIYDGRYSGGGKNNVGKVLKKAWGRTSLADSPLATISAMANNAIVQGERNKMLQKFYRLNAQNPNDAVKISEVWETIPEDGSSLNTAEWKMAMPEIREDMTSKEIADAIDTFNKEMQRRELEGTARKVVGRPKYPAGFLNKMNGKEHAVRVYVNGREKWMWVTGDPRAAQALRGEIVHKTGKHNYASKLMHGMAGLVTSYSPEFITSNFSRDTLFASANIKAKESWGYWSKFTKNQAKCAALMGFSGMGGDKRVGESLFEKYYRGREPKNETERMFFEFMDNGGRTGFVAQRKLEDHKAKLKAEIKSGATSAKVWDAVGNVISEIPKSIEEMNMRAELVNRFATYMTSREMGRSKMRSVADAKEVSVNFNRHGAGNAGSGKYGWASGVMRNYYMFFNAGMQSMNLLDKNLYKEDTHGLSRLNPMNLNGKKAGWSIATMGVIPAVAGYYFAQLLSDGDDEQYSNIPSWDRRNNICIPIKGEGYIKIPLPIELRAFWGMGDIMASMDKPRLQTEESTAFALAGQISQMMPLDMLEAGEKRFEGDTGWIPWLPTMVRPIAEQMKNVSWTGKPIQKENKYFEDAPEWTKAYSSTPDFEVQLCKWIHDKTRDGKNTAQETDVTGLDISPAKVDHLVKSYFGGAYSIIFKGANTGVKIAKGEVDMAHAPIVSRLWGGFTDKEVDATTNAKFWAYKREYDNTHKEYTNRANKTNPLAKQELNESGRGKRHDIFSKADKNMSKLQKRIDHTTDKEVKARLQEELAKQKRDLVDMLDGIE